MIPFFFFCNSRKHKVIHRDKLQISGCWVRGLWYMEGREEGFRGIQANLEAMRSQVYLYVEAYQSIHFLLGLSIKLRKSKEAKQ